MLVGPICLFLITPLMFPRDGRGRDFESYYFVQTRPVWLLAALAIVGSTSFRLLFLGVPVFVMDNATSFLGLVVLAVLSSSSNRRVHAVLVPLVLASLLYDVLCWSPVIS